jgi:DNA processing protein
MTERAAYLALARLSKRKQVHAVLAETGCALATWRRLGPPGRDPMAELLRAERGPDRIVTPADEEYRTGLRHLTDLPLALYLRGQPLPRGHSVAIVGSRKASPYGLAVAERFGRDLARAGVSVVSGLARGVDTAAHIGALRAPESGPVAVLGNGLDHDYPVENRGLRLRLERCGTVVSEYPRSDPPEPWRSRFATASSRASRPSC